MEEELCQHILKALGTFDYVAATKLIGKITKVKFIIDRTGMHRDLITFCVFNQDLPSHR